MPSTASPLTEGRRAALVLGLSVAAALLAQAWVPTRRMSDQRPAAKLADWVPVRAGEWFEDPNMAVVLPLPDVQAALDQAYDQVLGRTYVNRQGYRVMVSIAYGGDPRGGLALHLPEVCYPAQGFELQAVWPDTLRLPGRALSVRRATTVQGNRHEPLTYWLLAGDEVVTPGLDNRRVQLKHSLRGEIADGMLVRLSSIDPDARRAFAFQDQLAGQLLLALSAGERARLFGTAPGPAT